ncbi:hypothetical protein B0H14DRAFT_3508091 [Mycena olivaceomarginata]|nr:hypothetical protein B0H14DRAFT_3508091 [Mycena olivaceomarginata]
MQHSSPLPDFIHEVFAQLTSTNDTVFEAGPEQLLLAGSPGKVRVTLVSNVGKDTDVSLTSDVVTSSNLTRAAFGELVRGLRTELSERQLIKETFAVATPADPTNQTGAIAATHVLSAVQDEQQVVVTIASLLRIEWVQDEAYDQEGHREIVTEALITNAVPYQSDKA